MSLVQSLPEKPHSASLQASSASQQAPSPAVNPYLGPLAFKTGQRLYGRDRELNHLTNLVVAERIVLLHSPSGAGKTSLIQASLIPRLTTMRFHILHLIRVNSETHNLSGGKLDCNRYLFSTLLSLEEAFLPEERWPIQQLAQISLSDYLDQRQSSQGASSVLIFDQFEEILTLDPTDQLAKREFFQQIGEALESPKRWALFSMREDFVAALSPYSFLIPGHLSTTFRLDLLGQDAARQAIIQPAFQSGVQFDNPAAEKLVDDLRRVRVQRTDGSFEVQLGPSIEPVQLQVVCQRLWEIPRPNPLQITEQDLASLGEVDHALGDYYADRVSAAAMNTGVSERAIREWFDRQLITEQGVRGSVLMGAQKSSGLDNQAVQFLVDAYLIRAEKRAGITWYELSHDRLIAPVRTNNSAWFKTNLNVLQQQADLWDRHGRSENLLMHEDDLEKARPWIKNSPIELLPTEKDFISASEKQAARVRRLKQRNQIIYVLALLSFILTILTGLAYRQAILQRIQAQQQAQIAFGGQLAAQSQSTLQDSPNRSLLLAIEALNQSPTQPAAQEALRTALKDPHGHVLLGHQAAVNALAFSPDGHWLATGGDDTSILLWNMTPASGVSGATPLTLSGHTAAVTRLIFSPDGHWLASGSKDQTVRLWDMSAIDPSEHPITFSSLRADISALAFSPDSRLLAAGNLDQDISLWNLAPPISDRAQTVLSTAGSVWALAFSPDGQWLASSSGANARLWNLRQPDPFARDINLVGHQALIQALAFSPDGRWFATASRDETARLWDLHTPAPAAHPIVLTGHTDWVNTLAFSPNGRWLATGSNDKTARLWDLSAPDPNASPFVLHGHTQWVNTLAFSSNSRWLATGSADKTARLWDLSAADPSANVLVYRGHDDQVTILAFNPDGKLLATAGPDHTTRLWNVSTPDPAANPIVIHGIQSQINQVSFSPDGNWLSAISGDPSNNNQPNPVYLWNTITAGWNVPLRTYETTPDIPVLLRGSTSWLITSAFSSNGHWLAAAGGDGIAHLWDLTKPTPAPPSLVLSGHQNFITSLAFSPNAAWLATGSQDGTARLWKLPTTGAVLASPPQPLIFTHPDRVNALAFSPDGHWLATASEDITYLWDLTAANPTAKSIRLTGHIDAVEAVAFSPDGHWLATASRDKTARLWDLHLPNPNTQVVILAGHTDWVTSLAFSPDSAWLATASIDKTARLWNVHAGSPATKPFILAAHNAPLTGLAFSPQGHLLATASEDGSARLWNLDAADPSANSVALRDTDSPLTALAFSPDGRWLAVGAQDLAVHLWLVPTNQLIITACQSAGRDLTPAEWSQYFPNQVYHRTCEPRQILR